MSKKSKKKVTVALDEDILQWLDHQVNEKTFEDRSQGIRQCLRYIIRDSKHYFPPTHPGA